MAKLVCVFITTIDRMDHEEHIYETIDFAKLKELVAIDDIEDPNDREEAIEDFIEPLSFSLACAIEEVMTTDADTSNITHLIAALEEGRGYDFEGEEFSGGFGRSFGQAILASYSAPEGVNIHAETWSD